MSEVVPEGTPVDAAPVETPAEPEFTIAPEEWQATQERLAQIAEVVQPQPQPWQRPQPQGPPPPPSAFDDNFEERLQAWGESLIAPYAQFQQHLQMQEAEEQGRGILDQHATAVGEFDREMAWAQANLLVNQGVEVHQALEQAAKATREYERRVGEAYHQQQLEQARTVAGAPRGLPGTGTAGVQTVGVGGYGNVPGAVTNRLFGR